jgi:hypothetical protein
MMLCSVGPPTRKLWLAIIQNASVMYYDVFFFFNFIVIFILIMNKIIIIRFNLKINLTQDSSCGLTHK